MNCVADTHSLIWYLFALPPLSAVAKNYMDAVAASGGYIFIPSISLVEITYLEEEGRLGKNVLPRITAAIQLPNSVLKISEISLPITVALAQISRTIVPDMPDRIISATALHLGLPLVTKDGNIRRLQNIQTIW